MDVPTDFLECNALAFAMESMDEEATTVLRKLLPGELQALAWGCSNLSNLIHGVAIERSPGETYEERRLYWLNNGRSDQS